MNAEQLGVDGIDDENEAMVTEPGSETRGAPVEKCDPVAQVR
jgi:hypothetical protein